MLCLGLGSFIIYNFPPEVITILVVTILGFIFLATALSFLKNTNFAILVSLALSFLFFLKAVALLSAINLVLFAIFIVLLGLYLYKR